MDAEKLAGRLSGSSTPAEVDAILRAGSSVYRMELRLILAEDHPEWARMRHLLWPGWLSDHEIETRRYFSRPDPKLATFVVDRLNGRLGSFLEAGHRKYAADCSRSPVACIEGFVDDDLRRQGLGAALVAAVERWARDQGFMEI